MHGIIENGHLMVSLLGQPQEQFEVTEVIRHGPSLVLQCQPVLKGEDFEPSSDQDEPSSDQDLTVRVFITDDNAKPLPLHDPRRFYEDLL